MSKPYTLSVVYRMYSGIVHEDSGTFLALADDGAVHHGASQSGCIQLPRTTPAQILPAALHGGGRLCTVLHSRESYVYKA